MASFHKAAGLSGLMVRSVSRILYYRCFVVFEACKDMCMILQATSAAACPWLEEVCTVRAALYVQNCIVS